MRYRPEAPRTRPCSPLRLFLPASVLVLLVIDEAVPRLLIGGPALPAGRDRGVVLAIQHLDAELEAGNRARLRAIRQEQHGGVIGVLVLIGQPDRLALGTAVPL